MAAYTAPPHYIDIRSGERGTFDSHLFVNFVSMTASWCLVSHDIHLVSTHWIGMWPGGYDMVAT